RHLSRGSSEVFFKYHVVCSFHYVSSHSLSCTSRNQTFKSVISVAAILRRAGRTDISSLLPDTRVVNTGSFLQSRSRDESPQPSLALQIDPHDPILKEIPSTNPNGRSVLAAKRSVVREELHPRQRGDILGHSCA